MYTTGFHENIASSVYHSDALCDVPTLSSSIAKVLLRDTPIHAWTKHPKLNPDYAPGDDDRFDLGSVTHELILGKGAGFHVVDAPDWRTKDAQKERAEARADGLVPILAKHLERAEQVARAAERRLSDMEIWPTVYPTEPVLLWHDWHDVACRAMLDAVDLDNCVLYDVKTTERGLSDDAIARTIDVLGYDLSAGFYVRGLEALFPHTAGRWRMRWIFIEVEPPYELRVIQATPGTLEIGGRKAAFALARWEHCLRTGEWPGWPAEIALGGINDFAMTRWEASEPDRPHADVAPLPSRIVPSQPRELLGAC